MEKPLVLVKHDVNTSDEKSPDGDGWIHYWERRTQNIIPEECPCCKEKTSDRNPMVGAHVIKFVDILKTSPKRYITPTCKECNDKYKEGKAWKIFSVLPEHLLKSPY